MNLNRSLRLSIFCVAILSICQSTTGQEKEPPKITYDEHVKPVLRQKCFSCHNADKKEGDLDLTNYTNLMLGGGSGTVIEPGNSSDSYLYQLIAHTEEPYMPPESPKIPDEMIESVRKWIDGGVLENASSEAIASKKPKFDLALSEAPTKRPAVVPMPAKLSLEPVTQANKTTAVSALATSPWAPLAAVAGQKQVLLYNTQTLELVGTLPFPEGIPQVLKFSRNGSLLLAGGGRGGASGLCVVWNVKTGERIFEIGDELDAVLAADISSDQTLIALGGPQRVVRIYSTETGLLLHELRKHTDWVCSIEFSPDSVLLATGDRNGGLFVWEGWTGREYLTLKGHSKCITGVSWRSDSNILASSSEDTTIKLWEMNNGSQVKSWGAHGGGAASVEFTRDGRLFSCGRDRVPKLWKQDGGAIRSFEAFGDLALQVTFCDETNRAIAGDWTGEIRVWNAVDGARLGNLIQNPPTLAVRLDASQKDLVAKQTAHKPLADAYNAAQAAATKVKADLAKAVASTADFKKKLDAATATVATSKQADAQANAAQQAAAKAVTDVQAEVTALQQALAAAQKAATDQPDKKELADTATKAKTDLDTKVAQLDANKKVVAEKATLLDTAKKAFATAEQQVATFTAERSKAVQLVAQLTPQVKPAEDKAAAAKKAADDAAALVVAAQAQVNRWTEAIAFSGRYQELKKQLGEVLGLLAVKQTEHAELATTLAVSQSEVNKAKAELAAAQSEVAAVQKELAAANTAAATAKQGLVAATAARTGAAAAVTKLEGVLPLLTEAAAKTQEAVTKSGGDKELTDALTKLNALAAAKKTQFDASKASLAEKVKLEDAAKQKQATADKLVADTTARLTAAQKKVTDATPKLKPAEEKAAAAKKVLDAAQASVSAAEQQVDQKKSELAIHQGIKS